MTMIEGDPPHEERRRLERRVDALEAKYDQIHRDIEVLQRGADSKREIDKAQYEALAKGQESLSHQFTGLSDKIDLLESMRHAINGGATVLKWLGSTAIVSIIVYFFVALSKLVAHP